jgi:hypothetical protein
MGDQLQCGFKVCQGLLEMTVPGIRPLSPIFWVLCFYRLATHTLGETSAAVQSGAIWKAAIYSTFIMIYFNNVQFTLHAPLVAITAFKLYGLLSLMHSYTSVLNPATTSVTVLFASLTE